MPLLVYSVYWRMYFLALFSTLVLVMLPKLSYPKENVSFGVEVLLSAALSAAAAALLRTAKTRLCGEVRV